LREKERYKDERKIECERESKHNIKKRERRSKHNNILSCLGEVCMIHVFCRREKEGERRERDSGEKRVTLQAVYWANLHSIKANKMQSTAHRKE
jgi:hypothetical protein